ncbi:MAG TPA: tetratricopeptide repeat protein [candidate division Zixibacteria bacterium]|nr:tetratricopeptide repeat protein [candidate division Zixibacteria bacterium]
MQKLFDYFVERLPFEIKERLESAISHQSDLNPNDRLQKGTCIVLSETLKEKEKLQKLLEMKIELLKGGLIAKIKEKRKIDEKRDYIRAQLLANNELSFQLASLSCYLTQKMKATDKYLDLLRKINHPYIELFIAYFEENPSNYQESREKFELITKVLRKQDDFSDEMNAYVLSIKSWMYGQQGDVIILKEIYKSLTEHLVTSQNIVEIRGLEDAATNCIWWLLHSGVEANIEEMILFIEPYIMKNRLYQSYTDFLNLKGATLTYFGKTQEGMQCFEDLQKEYEKYKDNYRLSIAIGNLAETYFEIGKIILAKDMMEKAISLYKESTGKWPYLYLTELGSIYYLIGDPRAEESFLHAYEIQRKEKSLFKAFIMFELIHYYLREEQLENAKMYMKELQDLAKELQTLSVYAQVDYLHGYYELLDQNFSNSIKYFQSALEQGRQTKDFGLILSCNIQLTAAYLQKYRLNEKPETLNIALNFTDTAIKLAEENQYNQVVAIGLIIRSLLSSSKGEFKRAKKDLNKAKIIMKEIDFQKWYDDLLNIENKISKAVEEGKLVLDTDSVFKHILPQFKSILSIKLTEKKPVVSKVIGLLIISQSGVPVFTKLEKSLQTNQLILSGLLTAIDHLSESIIEGKDKGRLREVHYDKFWIIIQPIMNGIVAVIATEATAEIRLWANVIADRVEEVPIVISEFTNKVENKISDLLEQMQIK